MANLIIRPASGAGNKVVVQDQSGAAVLTTADSGATIANVASIQLTPTATGSAPSGSEGALYYDSDKDALMAYGTAWGEIKKKATASGGTETSISGYKVHTFLTSGTFTVTGGILTVEYLVIAAGGSGGGAGGGGAGGFRTGTVTIGSNQAVVVAGQTARPTSNAQGTTGSDSSFGLIVSRGGGGGGNYAGSNPTFPGQLRGQYTVFGLDGGSGGGGGWRAALGGRGTGGQGHSGGTSRDTASTPYTSAGGGGAGAIGADGDEAGGNNSGAGGAGRISAINGTSLYWAGGGGGGVQGGGSVVGGAGGIGGGGGGAFYSTGTGGAGGASALNSGSSGVNSTGGSGGANTGSGGGGMGISVANGGYGGSGIVIVRYQV